MAKQSPTFRVRLNCVDYYQALHTFLDPPLWDPSSISATQKANLPQVPVIRVFGATETGQKVCAHIHGAFPYLFIPYTESIEEEKVAAYIQTLRQAIDQALALSYRRNPHDNPQRSVFVAHISLVKGVPFFGYHVGYKHYLKIYLLNPVHMTRFADLLQQGAVMKQVFQPYEAHLQYLLQWMCDYNLYGCAYIDTDAPHFRSPVPDEDELTDDAHVWYTESIDAAAKLDPDAFPRQSHCELEVDIRVEDILNRRSVQARNLHHSFAERLASFENSPPHEKLVHSMAGLWKDETSRRKRRMGLTDPSSSPFPPEVLISMSADLRKGGDGGWIHEEEFRQLIDDLAKTERKARGGSNITFESIRQSQTEDGVQIVLDSVQDLFRHSLERVTRTSFNATTDPELNTLERPPGSDGQGITEDKLEAEMDVVAQLAAGADYDSDEEAARIRALAQKQNQTHASREPMFEGDEYTEAPLLGEVKLGSLKRSAIPGDALNYHKKARFDTADSVSPQKRVNFRVKDIKPKLANAVARAESVTALSQHNHLGKSAHSPIPSGQGPPISSQRSSQPSQNRQLQFPIIKTAHDRNSADPPSQQKTPIERSQNANPVLSNPVKARTSQSSRSSSDWRVSPTKPSTISPKTLADPPISPNVQRNYVKVFKMTTTQTTLLYGLQSPTVEYVNNTLVPSMIYQDAFYSNEKDMPERAREYAGQEFKLTSMTMPFLPQFDALRDQKAGKAVVVVDNGEGRFAEERRKRACTLKSWEIMARPPNFAEVKEWLADEQTRQPDDLDVLDIDGPPPSTQPKRKNRPAVEMSQIEGPTQKHKHGFKFSQHKASTSVQHETGYMSLMSLEVHVNSRDDLIPDPERDEIGAIVWCINDERERTGLRTGLLLLSHDDGLVQQIRLMVGAKVQLDVEEDELDLLNHMIDIVRKYDPDILTGFEVHNGSWGYLIERARLKYEFNLPDEFSRMRSQSHGRFGKDADRWGFTNTSTVRVTGRHTINIWRAMRSELNLLQYTMENVVFHLLHRRIPHYSYASLTKWYKSKNPRHVAKVLDYFITRTKLDLEILDANELIPRTSEQARLLGVDFFSVFSRGSQFKVESLMFRIAKPESFLLVSPSRKQVGAQNALECLPLVMEPQSAFYSSPLLVLDFQSLYPSVMIAYNFCYSTCLGRIVNWRGTNKLGFTDFEREPGMIELMQDKINVAPNGMMYVKPEMRKSLLAKMLGEILETRVMVKSGMKVDKDDRTLQQLLNNRQLALKLIANVTYGYTSASFSGRMPCSEIADSIVQTARETLEKAIAVIHSVERWGAEVVYGDTDSLFIYLKGRTRAEAFKIGDEIAKTITDMNPRPVKLKFEKVYHPCVLLAKKRYVGFKYESPNQTEPEFDAKGIETVRRDGTPAEQKMEEKALKLLFRTSDLSQVKRYFQSQCSKIMTGRFSVQDFCFAKEVKLGTYADKGPAPPGALIATRRMLRDPRAEPQYGERIPYVVIAGAPGARLWERCVEPERLIYDEHAELDAEYYINKNLIPPLERIFNLVGANVRQWYDEMPKVLRIRMLGGPRELGQANKAKKTMESYMGSSSCMACRTKLPPLQPATLVIPLPLCQTCRVDRTQQTLLTLRHRLHEAEKKAKDLDDVCRNCANLCPSEEVECDSRDCPAFYSRVKAKTQLQVTKNGVGRVLEALESEELQRGALQW